MCNAGGVEHPPSRFDPLNIDSMAPALVNKQLFANKCELICQCSDHDLFLMPPSGQKKLYAFYGCLFLKNNNKMFRIYVSNHYKLHNLTIYKCFGLNVINPPSVLHLAIDPALPTTAYPVNGRFGRVSDLAQL